MPGDSLERLQRDLGLKRLSHGWAKVEILVGLIGATVGLFGGIRLAVQEIGTGSEPVWTAWLSLGALVVLGTYLALAGHRSHLYQSNNQLTAYLAELVRQHHSPPSRTTL
jgi:hypothetical protein